VTYVSKILLTLRQTRNEWDSLAKAFGSPSSTKNGTVARKGALHNLWCEKERRKPIAPKSTVIRCQNLNTWQLQKEVALG